MYILADSDILTKNRKLLLFKYLVGIESYILKSASQNLNQYIIQYWKPFFFFFNSEGLCL